MSLQEALRGLAGGDAAAPFAFEVFERRQARALSRRRAVTWGSALSLSMLALVGILALVTQPRGDRASVMAAVEPLYPMVLPQAGRGLDSPALVELSRFALTSELEDHIALLDAQLSAARVQRAPPEQLRRIEGAREQMSESLQRVSYAHALLSL